MDEKNNCECHLIDWTTGPYYYKYRNGEDLELETSIDCIAKVFRDEITWNNYDIMCKYIPGKKNSLFPTSVYNKMEKVKY